MKRNKVMYGDCLEVLKGFDSNTFSCCITDPPYGLSKQPDMKEVLRHIGWMAMITIMAVEGLWIRVGTLLFLALRFGKR